MINQSLRGATADGDIEVADGDGASVVVFAAADVILDIWGFTVFGIPHIFDSVVLTGFRYSI
jgi:hypothetical protein